MPRDIRDFRMKAMPAVVQEFCGDSFGVSAPVLLASRHRCPRQIFHRDVDPQSENPTEESTSSSTEIPGAMLVAIDRCSLEVYRGNHLAEGPSSVWLDPGDVLLMMPDLVHAGSGYQQCNIRSHAFILPVLSRHVPGHDTHPEPAFEPSHRKRRRRWAS